MDKPRRRSRSWEQREHYIPRSSLSPEELADIRARAIEARVRRWNVLSPEEQERRTLAARGRRTRWAAAHPEQVADGRRRYLAENREREAAKARARSQKKYWSDPEAARAKNRAHWSPQAKAAQLARQHADPRIMFCTQANRRARQAGYPDDRIYPRDLPIGPWQCAYCAEPSRSFDHVLPFTRGGRNVASNIVPCCRPCNASKHNRLVSEWSGRYTAAEAVRRARVRHR